MNYLKHLGLNIKVALKGVILVLFHLVHGLIPIKLTDHEYWSFRLSLKNDLSQEQDDMLEIIGGTLGKRGRVLRRWKKRALKWRWIRKKEKSK